MEKRWSLRKPVTLDVVLHHGGLGLVRCSSRNLSLEGVYLKTGRIVLPIDAPVELDFFVPASDESKLHHIRAKVVRVTEEGAGLIFREFSAKISHFLQDAYYNV